MMHINKKLISLLIIALPNLVNAMGDGDPWLTKTQIDKFEVNNKHGSQLEAEIYSGKDLHKIWLNINGEWHNSDTESLDAELYYHQAISSFWNMQLGASRDFKPESPKNWLVLGFKGLAPFMLEVDAHLYVAEHGQAKLNASLEYELLFTQYLVLTPELEITAFNKNDEPQMTGKGLSSIEAGLRLRYEISRKFAPYIGINFEKSYGQTAD